MIVRVIWDTLVREANPDHMLDSLYEHNIITMEELENMDDEDLSDEDRVR